MRDCPHKTQWNARSLSTLRFGVDQAWLLPPPGDVALPTMSPKSEPPVTVRRSDEAGSTIVTVPAAGVDLEALECALIVFALETTGGNRTRAAKLLRLTRSALLYRLQKYGLTEKQGAS